MSAVKMVKLMPRMSRPAPHLGSKHPRLAKWMQYKGERATREQVVDWWTLEPKAGIAVITGPTSATRPGWSLVVLDWDDLDAFDEIMGAVENIQPFTLVAETRRGYHVFFYTKIPVSHARYVDIGLDVQTDGALITLTPSIHPLTGERYRWYNADIVELPPIAYVDDIYDILQAGGYKPPEPVDEGTSLAKRTYGEAWVNELMNNPVTLGNRNTAAFSLAGYFSSKNAG